MNKQKLLTVNHFNSQSRSQILPHYPLVSSQNLNLPQTQFDYYQFGAHETPAHIHTHHVVSIALEKVKTERKLDGVLQTEQQFFGSIGIFPANVEHWAAWKITAKFASIAIQPKFLANTAYEIANQNCIELIPTFAHQPDRFISGIALAIKHELETNSDDCQLYLESLFNELAVYLLQNYTAKKSQIEVHIQDAPQTKPAQTFVFEVQKAETSRSKPVITESGNIMFSQFKMKDPEKQSELAGVIEQMMPNAFKTVPGLQWAAMSPSTDKSTIAMIAQWNTREDFESLGKNAGFDKETNYWQTYADNEHDLFDVVKIIR